MLANVINSGVGSGFLLNVIVSFVIRGGAAFGIISLYVVIGRFYGAEGVGFFSLAQSCVLGMAIISRGGTENALMSFVSNNHTAKDLKLCIVFCFKKVTLKVLLFLAIAFIILNYLPYNLDDDKVKSLIVIVVALPFSVANFIIAGYFRGIKKTGISFLLDNGIVSLFSAISLLALSSIYSLSFVILSVTFVLCTILVSLFGLILMVKSYNSNSYIKDDNGLRFCKEEFISQSNTYFYMSMAGFVQNVLVVLMLGLLVNVSELGVLKSAERVSMLIGFSLIIMNAIVPPLIIKAYRERNIKSLSRYFKLGVVIPLGISSPFVLLIISFPDLLSYIFGNEFSGSYWILVLLSLSQIANLLAGPSDYLLNIAGEHKILKKSAITMIVSLLIFITLFTSWLGIFGAAFSICSTNIMYRAYLGYNACKVLKKFNEAV